MHCYCAAYVSACSPVFSRSVHYHTVLLVNEQQTAGCTVYLNTELTHKNAVCYEYDRRCVVDYMQV